MESDHPKPPSDYQSMAPFIPYSSFEEEQGSFGEGSLVVPRPMEALYETPIAPFLSKTFDLVTDPSLDAVISWGPMGKSFVVWDPVEFARTILPRNFKHSNFSSFVRQLNTYGFRKIVMDKWEFANEGFVRGQKHLLKNLQRRRPSLSPRIGGETSKCELEMEIENLKNERSLMIMEVAELQEQQHGTVQHMEFVKEKLLKAEVKQKQMVSFLGKMFQNPEFVARLRRRTTYESSISASPTRRMKKFLKHDVNQTISPEDSSSLGQLLATYQDELNIAPEFCGEVGTSRNPGNYIRQPDQDCCGSYPLIENVAPETESMLKDEYIWSSISTFDVAGTSSNAWDYGLALEDQGFWAKVDDDAAEEKWEL